RHSPLLRPPPQPQPARCRRGCSPRSRSWHRGNLMVGYLIPARPPTPRDEPVLGFLHDLLAGNLSLSPAPNTTYGTILPVAMDNTTGQKRLAMPGFMRDVLQGTGDLMHGAGGDMRPCSDSDTVDPRLTPQAMTALGFLSLPEAGAGAAAEAAQDAGTVASRSARLYNPPAVPQRAFPEDYPAQWPSNGVSTDEAGRLTYDIDGRPIDPNARVV